MKSVEVAPFFDCTWHVIAFESVCGCTCKVSGFVSVFRENYQIKTHTVVKMISANYTCSTCLEKVHKLIKGSSRIAKNHQPTKSSAWWEKNT